MGLVFDAARRVAAIVLGRAGMDLYPVPDGADTESAEYFAAEIGGSAANIAVAIARHNHKAALLAVFSDDAVGRFVRRHLERYGVDISGCRMVSGAYRTSLAICETHPTDSETVFYRNMAADLQLRREDVVAASIGGAAFLVVTGTALAAEPSRSAALQTIALARAAGVFSILDLDYRPVSSSSREDTQQILADTATRCDAVVGNEEEFSVMAGSAARALEIASGLLAKGCQLVIFKMGGAGCLTMTPDDRFETAPFAVEAKKPFGSGDAFLGNLIVGLLRGLPIAAAVRRAAAAAAYVVARRGCAFAMPSCDELDAFIASYPSS
jgi:5-dehydro-2-deoxygluconokinase